MLSSFVKSLALRFLPENALHALKKAHYYRSLKEMNIASERDLEVVRHLVQPGSVAIDIGANIGVYTMFLSRMVGPEGRVYAIEPVPQTCELLEHSLKKFGITNVNLLNYAISGSDGVLDMIVPRYESGGENYYRARIPAGNEEMDSRMRHVSVQCKSLDSLFPGAADQIAFVKIDVEGHERQVIEGGRETIKRWNPALLVEIGCNMDSSDCYGHEIERILARNDCHRFWFDGRNLTRGVSRESVANYFFLHGTHVQLVRRSDPHLISENESGLRS